MAVDQATPPVPPQHAVLVAPAQGSDDQLELFGMSARDHLRRGLEDAGVSQIDGTGRPAGERAAYLRTDHVYDGRVLAALLAADDDQLLCAEGQAIATVVAPGRAAAALSALAGGARDGFDLVAPEDLAPPFDHRLRKHSPPYALAVDAASVRGVESQLFRAAYKGISDFVTLWVWPLPALAATRWCSRRGITPNAVTGVGYALTLLVIGLWAAGFFATGLVLAWAMTFLDTVDGKLARVTHASSRIGHVLDHGLDLIHPPIWWAAWAWGLAAGEPGFGSHATAMWIVVGGYLAGRLLEGLFIVVFDMEMFSWRRFDGWFRQVIARRNPNLLLLTAGVLAGLPEAGFVALGAWTLGSIAIQLVRIGQALATHRAGIPIEPWQGQQAS